MNSFTRENRSYPPDSIVDRWLTPDGWPLRRFHWRAAAAQQRGSILFLTGRGDMFEKYLEAFAHFRAAGWNITSFDWRGQGGSGRVSEASLPHGGFDVMADDLGHFYRQWMSEEPGPHVLIGHSMGGHLLIRALAFGLVAPDAAVLVAPMLGISGGFVPPWLGAAVSRFMCRVGNPARPAWKDMEKPGIGEAGRQALLTHSAERYSDELYWHQTMPELKLGPPSWHWLREAYSSLSMMAESGTLERIDTPLLILAAEKDRLVDTAAICRDAARIRDCRLHVYGAEAAHEILREADPVRLDALHRIDAFLDEVAPAK